MNERKKTEPPKKTPKNKKQKKQKQKNIMLSTVNLT